MGSRLFTVNVFMKIYFELINHASLTKINGLEYVGTFHSSLDFKILSLILLEVNLKWIDFE